MSYLPFNELHASESKIVITRCNINTHVTALRTLKNYLFVAESNQVSVYSLIDNKFVTRLVVFSSSSIHGIRTDSSSNILFLGAKSLKFFSFNYSSVKCFENASDEILLPDWIHDAQWLNYSSLSNKVAAVLSHNSVILLDINNKQGFREIQCNERCILYSASIISTEKDTIIVAVGTVFKQILLWSPNTSREGNFSEVFHCLEGHQGVIFSLSFNKKKKLLSSTSDDRSIRLWKINAASQYSDFSLEFWKNSDIQNIHVLYGHESRVWASVVLQDCIISIGEDSLVCFWDNDGKLLRKNKSHKNGSIWCLETAEVTLKNGDISTFLVTGGSDGGVYFWEVPDLPCNSVSQISLCSHQKNFAPSENNFKAAPDHKNDFPRVVLVTVLDGNTYLITVSDKGWLSIYDTEKKLWKDVFYDTSFASYCISAVSHDGCFIALGNIVGHVVVLNVSECIFDSGIVTKTDAHIGKVCAVLWVDKKGDYILTCGLEGEMCLWKKNEINNSLSRMQCLHLPKCKPHWWCTCAVLIHSCKSLIVGDRGGSVSHFNLDANQEASQMGVKPNAVFKSIHGANGVTDVWEHQSLIYSSGRDGRVLLYSLKEQSLMLLHILKTPHNLEWIGKMVFFGSDLLLLGFHTKYFVVWSNTLECSVMTVECGGGHRSWDFQITPSGHATFAAIKKKDIVFLQEDLSFTLTKSVLKSGISGREFCKSCYLFNAEYESNYMNVLAVGGEDNTLRIQGFINDESNSPYSVLLHSLSGHLSSIRSIAKASMAQSNAYILATVGGRAQMILWKIKNDNCISCEQLGSYILSSEKKVKKPWKMSQCTQADPQTRLMDVCVICKATNTFHSELFIIAVACSDSYVRVFEFDAVDKNLSLSKNISTGDNCILKLLFLEVPQMKRIAFLAAKTNGNVSFLPYESLDNSDERPGNAVFSSLNLQLHQSGINALDIKCVSDSKWLICSGGDDNAVSATLIGIGLLFSESKIEIINRVKLATAHASQVTGLKILESKIVSTSIDQRINIWNLEMNLDTITITLAASVLSFIPDIADLECWTEREHQWKIAVCGEGIEILKLNET